MASASPVVEKSVDMATAKPVLWRPSLVLQGLVVLLLVLSVLPFRDGLELMWGWWLDRPEYSHGVLMPVLAAFLLWQQRDHFEKDRLDGSWWGVWLTLAGALLLLLGKLASVLTIIQYAYVVTLGGLMLSMAGTRHLSRLAVPFMILVLMIPLPEFIFKNLTADLQLLSSKIGVAFIRLCGVSVFLEGNIIDLGGHKLEVAEACSGLRYLFPLMTLGFIMGYLFKAPWWQRALIFLSSVPVTIIMNSLRIGMVGVTVDWWGQAMAEGFLHDFEGWIIFMCSAIVLLGEIKLLAWLTSPAEGHGSWRDRFGLTLPPPAPSGATHRQWQPTKPLLASAAVVLLLAAVTYLMPAREEVIPTRNDFAEFPMQIDTWSGRRSALEQVYLNDLHLDDYLLADYVDAVGTRINVYSAWYNSQRGGQSTHSPRTCIPGNGWNITDLRRVRVVDASIGGVPLSVNRALIQNGSQKQIVYYWFQQRGRVVTNEYMVKWYMFVDSLQQHRTDGALVRLIAAVPEGKSVAEVEDKLQAFARTLATRLPAYVPG